MCDKDLRSSDEEFLDETLLEAVPPHMPSDSLKAAIFAELAREDASEPADTDISVIRETRPAAPLPLPRTLKPGGLRYRSGMIAGSLAAVSVLVIGGSLIVPTITQSTNPSTAPVDYRDPHAEMHEIMKSEDMAKVTVNAAGAQLDIVASKQMEKAGAMVQGAAATQPGMGIQVWSQTQAGEMISAGVIGPEDHQSVWMPLDGHTVKVILTEEPMTGSEQPTGTMLAEVILS
ncbi:anti-sigma factor [Corynebacterium sp. ES2794-CONJ1]|uniref:anti-sigma factor n=1 Tax=unclassified Corynebacterium TaxID=2624378 RepID=UPI00216929ED|nr:MULTISPECIES: anti-sigma factor [unclassified Corynebacterium]MCS4490701.1 anti-sigma factor [Corynebacterium sp. ES2775-CONJ]MCS4492503.1 anti-sigma factor [Corynebacterium sp. ES2715-CONJ3]MCS4532533.1 anti-sigma factor [Corynebacterium sp. ES2730-CONJ]MCU9519928.1 anti-sigma factor [Corynebacterium sp. ES2794-CONJ1]